MNLNATDKSIQVKLGESISAAQLDVTASYVDLNGNNYEIGASDLVTNGTSLVTAVASPSGSDMRTVKEISITNTDSIPHSVIVYYVAGADQRAIQEALLETGQTLQYANGLWTAASSAANLTTPTPLLTGTTTLTIYDKYTLGDLAFSIASLLTADMPRLSLVLGSVAPSNMASLARLTFPSLTTVGGNFIPVNLDGLTVFDISSLITVGGNFSPDTLGSLTSLDISSLTTVGGKFTPQDMNSLTSIDMSSLVTVGDDLNLNSLDSLTSFAVPLLATVGGGLTAHLPGLVTFTITSALKLIGSDVSFTGSALDQSSVDLILVRVAALDGTAGTTSYDNHTVDLSGGTNATPSATGLAAKATLEGRGNTVNVN